MNPPTAKGLFAAKLAQEAEMGQLSAATTSATSVSRKRWSCNKIASVCVAIISVCSCPSVSLAATSGSSGFTERLLIRPLEDGHVLANWHFETHLHVPPSSSSFPSSSPCVNDFVMFPKSLGQLLCHYSIDELHVSLTSGRYWYANWGYPQYQHHTAVAAAAAATEGNENELHSFHIPYVQPGPNGAELWAAFDPIPSPNNNNGTHQDEEEEEEEDAAADVDDRWMNLQQSLAGILCSSLHQIGSVHMSTPSHLVYSSPSSTPHISSSPSESSSFSSCSSFSFSSPSPFVRYGTLPRENVCTENLTPWIKLLPCRNQAGLGKLLHSLKLYDTTFHSLQVKIERDRNQEGEPTGWKLVQSLVTVINTRKGKERSKNSELGWSLQSLFGEQEACDCPVAESSEIVVHFQPWFVSRFNSTIQQLAERIARESNQGSQIVEEEGFRLSHLPDRLSFSNDAQNVVLLYHLKTSSNLTSRSPSSSCIGSSSAIQLSLTYPSSSSSSSSSSSISPLFSPPLYSYASEPPILFHRYLTGTDHYTGRLHIEIYHQNIHQNKSTQTDPLRIRYFDSIPWFLRVYFHTLTVHWNGRKVLIPTQQQQIEQRQDDPHFRTTHLLQSFRFIPSVLRSRSSEFEFEFLLPSSSLLVIEVEFEKSFLTINNDYPPDVSRGFDLGSGIVTILSEPRNDGGDSAPTSRSMLPCSLPIRLYTDGLLVLLPYPDCSMPFNVIAFTSTVLAFFFGSLFNMLHSSEQEILNRDKQNLLQRIKQRLTNIQTKWRKAKPQQPQPQQQEQQQEEEKSQLKNASSSEEKQHIPVSTSQTN